MKRKWLVPWLAAGVALLFLAMGPGKSWEVRKAASQQLDEALKSRAVAEASQREASAANLAALQARAAARSDPTPDALRLAAAATTAEERAYGRAKEAWSEVAAHYEAARSSSVSLDPQTAATLRLERDAALIGAGDLSGAAGDLEEMLHADETETLQPPADQVREQLSRAYFHAAYLLRRQGGADETWRLLAERARQHARVLAEAGVAPTHPTAVVDTYQRNLEVIMDFERRSLEELEAEAQPKDCAGNCTRPKLDSWPWGGKPKKPNGELPGDQRRNPDKSGEPEEGGGW